MKKTIGRVILSPQFQSSMMAPAARQVIRKTQRFYRYSPRFLADFQVLDRSHYAYCMLGAADLAKRLGKDEISAIEFGVAGGNGIKFMCRFARDVERATGVKVRCYGFDTGQGMPAPEGPKDLPYWFKADQYKMDIDALRQAVPDAEIIIGNIGETISDFVAKYDPAPIGAIMNDVDYHSSTHDTLRLLEDHSSNPGSFLPRLFMYFDDIIGSEIEMYGPFNGQLNAISEFNDSHSNVKVHLNQNLMIMDHLPYRHQIYYAHLFDHPEYGSYVGGRQQLDLEEALRLTG